MTGGGFCVRAKRGGVENDGTDLVWFVPCPKAVLLNRPALSAMYRTFACLTISLTPNPRKP